MARFTKNFLGVLFFILFLLLIGGLCLEFLPESNIAKIEKQFISKIFHSSLYQGKQSTVNIQSGTSLNFNNANKYVAVEKTNNDFDKISIYIHDITNAEIPIKEIFFPQGEKLYTSYNIFYPLGLQHFNSKGEYYLITHGLYEDKDTINLFKISINGTAEKIASNLSISNNYFIDQENLQIAYSPIDTLDIVVYDINKKTYKHVVSYDPKKNHGDEIDYNNLEDFLIENIYNYQNGIVYFNVDHSGIDSPSRDYIQTCIDINRNIELDSNSCKIVSTNNRIKFGYTTDMYDGEQIVYIDDKEIGIFTGITFIDIVGDYVLGFTSINNILHYNFYKIDDVINHRIPEPSSE